MLFDRERDLVRMRMQVPRTNVSIGKRMDGSRSRFGKYGSAPYFAKGISVAAVCMSC